MPPTGPAALVESKLLDALKASPKGALEGLEHSIYHSVSAGIQSANQFTGIKRREGYQSLIVYNIMGLLMQVLNSVSDMIYHH